MPPGVANAEDHAPSLRCGVLASSASGARMKSAKAGRPRQHSGRARSRSCAPCDRQKRAARRNALAQRACCGGVYRKATRVHRLARAQGVQSAGRRMQRGSRPFHPTSIQASSRSMPVLGNALIRGGGWDSGGCRKGEQSAGLRVPRKRTLNSPAPRRRLAQKNDFRETVHPGTPPRDSIKPSHSQPREPVAFVQASAVRAARKKGAGGVFELEGAECAAEDVAKCLALTALTPPFRKKPGSEDRDEDSRQAEKDEHAEAYLNHGSGWGR